MVGEVMGLVEGVWRMVGCVLKMEQAILDEVVLTFKIKSVLK
jgi:hypothetical protein